MKKIVRKFRTHEEAEAADREFYKSLTPEERVMMCFELSERTYGTPSGGIQKVVRKFNWDRKSSE